jgi:hypothetical protein
MLRYPLVTVDTFPQRLHAAGRHLVTQNLSKHYRADTGNCHGWLLSTVVVVMHQYENGNKICTLRIVCISFGILWRYLLKRMNRSCHILDTRIKERVVVKSSNLSFYRHGSFISWNIFLCDSISMQQKMAVKLMPSVLIFIMVRISDLMLCSSSSVLRWHRSDVSFQLLPCFICLYLDC